MYVASRISLDNSFNRANEAAATGVQIHLHETCRQLLSREEVTKTQWEQEVSNLALINALLT